jgi:CRP-like cAMP-binding protein
VKIQEIPALQSLNETQFENLQNAGESIRLRAGDTLIERGEERADLYILLEGELQVFVNDGKKEVELIRLNAPSVVGELELLTGQPRTASVRAGSDAELLMLPHDKIDARIVDGDPATLKVMVAISRLLAGRLSSMTEKFVELENSVEPARSHELADFRKKLFSEWTF